MSYPAEYRYTKDHEWVHIEGDRARVGITDHAQKELGDIVFVELPAIGTEFGNGDNLATVESVKAVGEVDAPFSGKIVEVNSALESAPETINQSPHEEGWILVIEPAGPNVADGLLSAADYEKLIAEG